MSKPIPTVSLKILTVLYFIVALIEVTAEFYKDTALIWCTKPLLIPILASIYCLSSKKPSYLFLMALTSSWIANLFFISSSYDDIVTGTYIFLIYRVLIIYLVLRLVKLPGILPMILGSLPFLFIYLYVINMAYKTIGNGLPMFISQGLFISFLGGYSVGNYILKSNKANTLLLISTMMFAFTQFLFVIKLYYVSLNIFQPLAMTLFAMGQFVLCRFMVIAEKRKHRAKKIMVSESKI